MSEFPNEEPKKEMPAEKLKKALEYLILEDSIHRLLELRFGHEDILDHLVNTDASGEELKAALRLDDDIVDGVEFLKERRTDKDKEHVALREFHEENMKKCRDLESLKKYCDGNEFLWLSDGQMSQVEELNNEALMGCEEEDLDSIIEGAEANFK